MLPASRCRSARSGTGASDRFWLRPPRVSSFLVLVHANDVEACPRESREHQHDGDPRRGVEPLVERETDDDAAERVAEHRRDDAPAHPGLAIGGVVLRQPLLFRLARSREAILERIERWVFGHRRLGCVVGIVRHGGRTGPVARNYGKSRGNGLPVRASAAPLERGWVRVNRWETPTPIRRNWTVACAAPCRRASGAGLGRRARTSAADATRTGLRGRACGGGFCAADSLRGSEGRAAADRRRGSATSRRVPGTSRPAWFARSARSPA